MPVITFLHVSQYMELLTTYKRISEQYVNQDILNYVRVLLPEEIVKKTTIESKEEPLKSVLQWFKKDFMRWTPKDPNCDRCHLPMGFQYIKEIHGNCEAQRNTHAKAQP
jgi:hypothetical protein